MRFFGLDGNSHTVSKTDHVPSEDTKFTDSIYDPNNPEISKKLADNMKFKKGTYVTVEQMANYSNHIMELSGKNRKETESKKYYCHKCSYRLEKNSWNFCPSCGSQIERNCTNLVVGKSKEGPYNKPVYVDSYKTLYDVFGKPDAIKPLRKGKQIFNEKDPYGEELWEEDEI